MKLTVISENYAPLSIGLMAEHGFSVFIEINGKKLLFDTGQQGICVHNANLLGCDLRQTDTILLSHGHYDHSGGLERVLQTIRKPVQIIGHSAIFGRKYALKKGLNKTFIGISVDKGYLEDNYNATFNFQNDFYEIDQGVWLTGQVPMTNEFEQLPEYLKIEQGGELIQDKIEDDNSLVIDTDKGLLVIFGCAHRGIVNILSYIKEKLDRPIYGVVGGLHLYAASIEHLNFVKDFLKSEDIQLFAPSHCTGIDKIVDFSLFFQTTSQPAFCGSVIKV
jgi:7,8-dihydropterin-6-yl-methyl-4-(beta-D-ribofuranosyl)aminobenzene 5'-phosphate synthase